MYYSRFVDVTKCTGLENVEWDSYQIPFQKDFIKVLYFSYIGKYNMLWLPTQPALVFK